MNIVDMIILGAIGLIALMGLKSGLLKPVSGIGGLILGVLIAVQMHGEAAVLLEEYIDKELWRNIAAFIAIVLATTIATRIIALLIKKLLSALVLGWVDHVAGAFGGAAFGLVLAATALFIASGVDHAPTRAALAESVLAPDITRASLLSSSTPWCSSLPGGAASGECTDFKGLVSGLIGVDVSKKVDDLLGDQELGDLVEVVKGSLNGGTPQELVQLANAK